MRKDKDPAGQLDRRGFLKGAGLALGSAGAVAAIGEGEAVAASSESQGKSAGYQETEHVRRYYELARF